MTVATRGDRRIHYQSYGHGHTVILVPGIGAGARLFGTLPRQFERAGFRCITFDPVGVAPSSPHTGAYDLAAAGRDVLAIADDIGAESFDLVGISLGGKVALVTADLAASRVHRLVMLASAAVTTPRSMRILRFFEILATRLEPTELGEVMAAFLFGRSFHSRHPEVVENIVRSMRLDADTRALMVAQARGLRDFDGHRIAALVPTPTLCIAGGEDPLAAVDEIEATAELLVGGQFQLVPAAGHSLLLEAAEVLGATIAFLQAE